MRIKRIPYLQKKISEKQYEEESPSVEKDKSVSDNKNIRKDSTSLISNSKLLKNIDNKTIEEEDSL